MTPHLGWTRDGALASLGDMWIARSVDPTEPGDFRDPDRLLSVLCVRGEHVAWSLSSLSVEDLRALGAILHTLGFTP